MELGVKMRKMRRERGTSCFINILRCEIICLHTFNRLFALKSVYLISRADYWGRNSVSVSISIKSSTQR